MDFLTTLLSVVLLLLAAPFIGYFFGWAIFHWLDLFLSLPEVIGNVPVDTFSGIIGAVSGTAGAGSSVSSTSGST